MSFRILHIDTERTWRGGEQQALSLIEKSAELGHHVFLAAPPESAIISRIDPARCKTFPTPLLNSMDVISAIRCARICANHQIDIIHAHTSRAHSIGLITKRLMSNQVKLVVSRRVEFPVRGGWFGKRKYQNVDFYISISNAIANHLREGGIEETKIKVVHSGIDPKRFMTPNRENLLREFDIEPSAFVVGNIAFCEHRKRQIDILDAIPMLLKSCGKALRPHFFIVGDGEEKETLMRHAKRLGVDELVHFTGFRKDIEDFYGLFDVFVMVSENEGLCNSLMEAQFFGVPAIVTRVGGMVEVVTHETNGLVIPPKSPVAIADAILKLMNDPEAREKMGAQGKEIVLKNFTVDAMAQGVIASYQSIMIGA